VAILPQLEDGEIQNKGINESLISDLQGWLQTLIVIGTIALIYFAGRFIIVPLLHVVAATRLQELFTGAALLLVLSVSYIMQMVGVSPALGAFMAGVALAYSEFRNELEGDLAPC